MPKEIPEIVESCGAIVFANPEFQVLITWNGSATFNWFSPTAKPGFWENTDVATRYEVTALQTAEAVAKEWFTQSMADLTK